METCAICETHCISYYPSIMGDCEVHIIQTYYTKADRIIVCMFMYVVILLQIINQLPPGLLYVH